MKPSRLVETLLTVLPVLTAGLYLLGLSYHQGYLDVYGVDDSLFPLASDKALFTGFFSLSTVTFPAALYAIGALGAFVILVTVAAVLSSTARVQSVVTRIKMWLNGRNPKPVVFPVAESLVDKSAALYGYASGFIIALVLLVLMAAFSAKSGQKQAEKEVADFQNGKTTSAHIFSAQAPLPYIGKLVMCGDKYCAFWSSTGTIILRHESIDRIVTHNPSLKVTGVGKPMSPP